MGFVGLINVNQLQMVHWKMVVWLGHWVVEEFEVPKKERVVKKKEK